MMLIISLTSNHYTNMNNLSTPNLNIIGKELTMQKTHWELMNLWRMRKSKEKLLNINNGPIRKLMKLTLLLHTISWLRIHKLRLACWLLTESNPTTSKASPSNKSIKSNSKELSKSERQLWWKSKRMRRTSFTLCS